ncbi:MAG: hypothetical protein ACHQ1H_02490 [Nitrososphaerales archaeon]
MKIRIAIILATMFLLFVGAPLIPSTALTTNILTPVRQATTTMFDYTVTLYPSNSSWTASLTNIGPSVVWNTVSISNTSIQENEFLLGTAGTPMISPGETVRGSFQCHYFNGTLGVDSPCTLSNNSQYRFCTSLGNNTGTTAFDEVLGCFNVRADGLMHHGSTHHRIDVEWRTALRGGKLALWGFRLRNVGTRTIVFSVNLSWPCDSPTQGWITCTKQTPRVHLASGQVYSFRTTFKPAWDSLPSGTSGITVSVSALFKDRFQLNENVYNLTAA